MESIQFLRRQIRWVLLLRVTLFSVLLGVSSLLQVRRHELNIPQFPEILIFIIVIFTFSISSEFVLRKVSNLTSFAYGQILADSVFITIIVNFTGGPLSIFAILYFFPVLSAGVILPNIGGLALASLNTILYSLVLFVRYIPIIKDLGHSFSPAATANIPTSFQALSVYGISFFLAAILSSILSKRFRQTRAQLSSTTHDLDSLNLLYKQIFNDISSGIITVDAKGQITSFNKAAEEITAYTQEEVLSSKISHIFPELKAIGSRQERHSTKLSKKNKDKIAVGYSWARLNMPDDSKNSRVYTLQDLSKIKQMEAKVQQAEKMAAIGEIAAGIAHEFRNPLAAISGATQILCTEPNLSKTNISLLTIIKRECDRLGSNINDFLQFSKPAVPEKKWFAIATIIKESIDVVRHTTGFDKHCSITTTTAENLDCWGDQHQLKQILINLIHNSSQAVPPKSGTISINATINESDHSHGDLELEVIDNGSGIEPKMINSIFEPFVTTKENGTGLGLAIVQQIVIGHGGRLKINSTPNKGTSITIYLPLP